MQAKKIAIVTGGSRGIGKKLVEKILREKGLDVMYVSRNPIVDAVDVPEERKLIHLPLDLSDAGAYKAVILRLAQSDLSDYKASLLIHNAAVTNIHVLDTHCEEMLTHSLNINTVNPTLITAAIAEKGLFDNDEGARVVYITSSAGRLIPGLTFNMFGIYSATKAAAKQLFMTLRREFNNILQAEGSDDHRKVNKVRIDLVYPGIVLTDMQKEMQSKINDEKYKALIHLSTHDEQADWKFTYQNPTALEYKRVISPEESAKFILWTGAQGALEPGEEFDYYAATAYHQSLGRLQLEPLGHMFGRYMNLFGSYAGFGSQSSEDVLQHTH